MFKWNLYHHSIKLFLEMCANLSTSHWCKLIVLWSVSFGCRGGVECRKSGLVSSVPVEIQLVVHSSEIL